MEITKTEWSASIEFYRAGVALTGLKIPSSGGPGGKRGSVTGWSKSSRRRMREYMLTHDPAQDSILVGATFTIPGKDVLEVHEVSEIWRHWCREADRSGWGAVWRMEVQKRGAVHWHVLAVIPRRAITWMNTVGGVPITKKMWLADPRRGGSPDAGPIEDLNLTDELGLCDSSIPVVSEWQSFAARCVIVKSWHKTLDRSFTPEGVSRRSLPGAYYFSASATVDDGRGAWLRYLQDHATKSKREQVAEGFGRHWGVIGRKRFVRVLPDYVCKLDSVSYYRFLRAYQRLCTPQLKDGRVQGKQCRFGRRLGRRIRRGSMGRSVWYSNPETVRRLVDWAVSF